MNPNTAGLPPIHPGTVLAEDVIPGSGLSKAAFARRLGMSRESLYNILKGQSAVTPVTALKLSRLLKTTPELWLNLQRAYDLAMAMRDSKAEIEQVEALEAA